MRQCFSSLAGESFFPGLVFVLRNFCQHRAMFALKAWIVVLLGYPVLGLGAEADSDGTKHGLTPGAVPLFELGPLMVTNSMLVTWVVAGLLILFSQLAIRKARLVPSGWQNFWEWLVESLYGFFKDILGAELVKKTFWFFATVFIFILFSNWFGLLPGVGTIGWGSGGAGEEFHLTKPLLRGVNADLNMTAAMALAFFALWIVWAIQANGVGGVAAHIFQVKGHGASFLGIFLVAVFLFVGVIEIVSILVRPLALMFRLYGNIFAGENILETMLHKGGFWFGWLFALPFYFLELLVGLVQALVFALLTSVFTMLICRHEDEEHAHGSGS